jgi:quercetin dioxygenase-like cupin family protein
MTAEVRLGSIERLDVEEAFVGVTRRRVDGAKCTLLFYAFASGAAHGLHSHAEEQGMVVTSGSCQLHLGSSTRTATVGDYCVIPPDVEHGITAGESGVELTVIIAPRRTTEYEVRPLPAADESCVAARNSL